MSFIVMFPDRPLAVFVRVDKVAVVNEYGGFREAFSEPVFFIRTGGNIAGISLGLVGSVKGGELGGAMGACFGPGAIVPGVVIGGLLVGTGGYVVRRWGGSSAADWLLKELAPDFYYREKADEIDRTIERYKTSVAKLEELPKSGK